MPAGQPCGNESPFEDKPWGGAFKFKVNNNTTTHWRKSKSLVGFKKPNPSVKGLFAS